MSDRKELKTIEVRLRFFTNELPRDGKFCWPSGAAIVIANPTRGIKARHAAFGEYVPLTKAVNAAMKRAGIKVLNTSQFT